MNQNMNQEMIPISLNDKLNFKCSSDNACFNDCCRDLNQFLTPYDILRLKTNLGITSDVFLKKYTSFHNGPESGLPIVTFKADPASKNACPFVTAKGCSVYADRPASCRIYPLARAISRSRETGKITEYFALIKEPHCKGFNNENTLSAGQWVKTQDVDEYNEMNDKLMEIISLKNRIILGALDKTASDKFYLACYDLDTFRNEILNNGLLNDYSIPDHVKEMIKDNDLALLDLGLSWVKNFLFGINMEFV